MTTPSTTLHSSRSVILTVAEIIKETSDAHSIIFQQPTTPLSYLPGQFLTFRIPSEQTGSVARCYSLASNPFSTELPKVTVKRTAAGYASNWLCNNLSAGDALEALPPSGVFTPKSFDVPILLFGAGSGITPVMSILKAALTQGNSPVVLFYANRSEADVIFNDELTELQNQYSTRLTIAHWLETTHGLPTAGDIAEFAQQYSDSQAYMCGPGPFMDGVHAGLKTANFPHNQVHAEVFNSLHSDPFVDIDLVESTAEELADAASVSIELDGTVHELVWPRNQTLVDVMLTAGIDVPYSCREGECGSCACTLTEGTVEMEITGALDPDDIADGYILGCQAKPTADVLKIEF